LFSKGPCGHKLPKRKTHLSSTFHLLLLLTTVTIATPTMKMKMKKKKISAGKKWLTSSVTCHFHFIFGLVPISRTFSLRSFSSLLYVNFAHTTFGSAL